jgi:hypothetical protein
MRRLAGPSIRPPIIPTITLFYSGYRQWGWEGWLGPLPGSLNSRPLLCAERWGGFCRQMPHHSPFSELADDETDTSHPGHRLHFLHRRGGQYQTPPFHTQEGKLLKNASIFTRFMSVYVMFPLVWYMYSIRFIFIWTLLHLSEVNSDLMG